MMMKSPTHSKSEASYHDAYGFDLQEDFSQFLEEARKYEMIEAKVKSSSSVYPEESSDKEKEKKSGKKKKKKSWKSSVISWWNAEKKSKPTTNNNNINSEEEQKGYCGKKQSHVSGPIYNPGKSPNSKKQWRPHSGPLITSLFSKSSKKENHNEIPYVCLQQQNSPQDFHIQNYGSFYIVS